MHEECDEKVRQEYKMNENIVKSHTIQTTSHAEMTSRYKHDMEDNRSMNVANWEGFV
jgi:hypothetical protein